MEIVVNGERQVLPEGASVEELIRRLGLERQACAVEVNKELVPKKRHADRGLNAGDRVEIVTLVGGG